MHIWQMFPNVELFVTGIYRFLALGGLIRFVEAIYHEECEHEMFGGLRLPLLLSSPANAL